jgi:hypothetical protein
MATRLVQGRRENFKFEMALLASCELTVPMEYGDGQIGLREGKWPTFSKGLRPRAEQAPPLREKNQIARRKSTEAFQI